MPQLPENIRPYVAALAKYHFWILAAIVPLVLLPMLYQGTASLDTLITGQRSQIESRVSALKGVQGIPDHPNEGWSETVEAQTGKIREETFAEWEKFWNDQQFLHTWPAKLGDDFVKAIGTLKPGGALNRAFLNRYQNTVPELVRELPARMGADDFMLEGAGPTGVGGEGVGPRGGFGGDFGPRPGPGGDFQPRPNPAGMAGVAGSDALVSWAAEDQKRLFESFRWEKPPSTTQVVLAQEELWVYGLLCDVIKKANAGAGAAFNSPITAVQQLAVGYPATEDQPGGQGAGRIVMAASAPGGGEQGMEGMPPPDMGMGVGGEGGAGAMGRPAHPRFGGASGPGATPGSEFGSPPEGGDPAAAVAVSPDDALKEWIYVDFSGKPLTSAELGTLPAAKMVHLMPFVLRMTMDQRKLDGLLADLASAAVPIDVRQVRINPAQQTGGGGGMGGGFGRGELSAPSPTGDSSGMRPHDIVVELRGTVGLAPQPDKNTIGGGEAPAGEGGA